MYEKAPATEAVQGDAKGHGQGLLRVFPAVWGVQGFCASLSVVIVKAWLSIPLCMRTEWRQSSDHGPLTSSRVPPGTGQKELGYCRLRQTLGPYNSSKRLGSLTLTPRADNGCLNLTQDWEQRAGCMTFPAAVSKALKAVCGFTGMLISELQGSTS